MIVPMPASASPLTLYVSENGRDTNPGTARAPFATLGRLRDRLRETPGHGPVTVRLRGTFRLSETLVLGPEADGVRFVGPAVLSGGTELRDWREARFNGRPAWATAAPEGAPFRQLFVGDRRAPRPRLPKTGFHAFAGYGPDEKGSGNEIPGDTFDRQTAMRFREGDIRADWRNREDVEIVAHHFWVTSRLPIATVEGDVVGFTKRSVMRLKDDFGDAPAPYAVENVAEALDAPGEWYHDRPSRTVYYLPRPGESRDRFVAVAPRLATLVQVQGARRTSFEGVTFRHTEWTLPADSSGDVQAAFSVPGAVQFHDADGAALERCRIEGVGTYGVEISGASKGCRVAATVLRDLGAGGVKIGSGTEGTTVSDNVIEGGGRIFASAVGVLVQLSGGNRVVHNRIRDFSYTGVSVGWDWGFADTSAKDNVVADNEISDIGRDELSDMGGIYVLGKQPGSRIERNRIRRVSARGYGGWGIYLDEGSTGWVVQDNVVTDTKTGGFHIHYGGGNVIRNNVFAYARREGQLIRQRDDKQGPILFEHNLVVARPGDAPLVVPGWLRRDVRMTGMLYATPPGELPFGDDGTGRFVATKLGRDGLPPKGSPAYQMGFRPIDLGGIGPRTGR